MLGANITFFATRIIMWFLREFGKMETTRSGFAVRSFNADDSFLVSHHVDGQNVIR